MACQERLCRHCGTCNRFLSPEAFRREEKAIRNQQEGTGIDNLQGRSEHQPNLSPNSQTYECLRLLELDKKFDIRRSLDETVKSLPSLPAFAKE